MAPTETAWAIIQADPDLSMFAQAVTTAGLQGDLESGLITVLAPTNAAVGSMPDSAAILADPAASDALVRAHIVNGELDSAAIFASASLTAQNGDTLTIDGALQTIAGPDATASIVNPDHHATNGFVHSINAVLNVPDPPATTTTTDSTTTTVV